MKPKFTHDCNCCRFLGTHEEQDLYYCHGNIPTVIARHSSDGPDYTSGLSFVNHIPILGEAAKRALEKGYLKQETLDFWTRLS